MHSFVRLTHVRRVRIGVGVYRDRTDPQFLAGAHNAQGDLAAVRDQDLLEHQGRKTRRLRLASSDVRSI
jgi:predicted nucleic acid-binding protein